MDAFSTSFGSHLRSLRQGKGLTQEEVAHRADIHVTYLSGIERGWRNPSLKNTRKIAMALGIPLRELFSFEESSFNH